jgi:uncharacterized membrane protein
MKLDITPEAIAEDVLGRPYDQLGKEEQDALCKALSHDVGLEPDEAEALHGTKGDRLADKVASVGGSWGFIIVFSLILASWMLINSKWAAGLGVTWDEYPYIFLNLMLSTVAALQAPVIMMSQNRQSKKDRIANRHDFEVNLRTTVELLILQRKVDRIFNKLGQMEQTVEGVAEVTEGAIEQAIELGESQRSGVS